MLRVLKVYRGRCVHNCGISDGVLGGLRNLRVQYGGIVFVEEVSCCLQSV